MILSAIPKQFTLNDLGQIFYQPDSTNPLPGSVIARVIKGGSMLQPQAELLSEFDCGSEDRAAVQEFLGTWLKAHIYTVLQPLFNLININENPDTPPLPECVKSIFLKVFDGMGISPRLDNESAIAELDADMRKILRDKKLRMGPVLIFLGELNKPAAVRLRGLLWSLYHDRALPAPLPKDGAMSMLVEPDRAADLTEFYRAIGYPLYGPRAIRIDMLDRVINAIYDGAKDGKFQAKHMMAEWIGCPIADLYAILEALGHKRLENSAPQMEGAPAALNTPTPQDESKNESDDASGGVGEGAAVLESLAPESVTSETVAPESVALAAPSIAPQQMSLFDDPPPAAVSAEPESLSPEQPMASTVTAEITEATTTEATEKPKKILPKKPELDFFVLRRGKAYAPARNGAPRRDGDREGGRKHHGGPRRHGPHAHGPHAHGSRSIDPHRAQPHDANNAENGGNGAQNNDSAPSKKFSKPDKFSGAFPPERYAAKGQKPGQKFGKKFDPAEDSANGAEHHKGESKPKPKADRAERGHQDRDFASKKSDRFDRKHDSSHKKSEPRVYTAEAATHDNPFAVLKGLNISSGK